jgi:hypothetical protein
MSRLLPLNRIAQCIIYPSKGDRQDDCGDRSNTRQSEVFHSHPIGILAKAQKKVVGMAL